MGKYERAGREALEKGKLDYTYNEEAAILSLKILDLIVENQKDISVEGTLQILEDSKHMLFSLLGT